MNNYDIFIIYQCIHSIGKLVYEKGETTIYNMMNNYDFIHHILCIYFFSKKTLHLLLFSLTIGNIRLYTKSRYTCMYCIWYLVRLEDS